MHALAGRAIPPSFFRSWWTTQIVIVFLWRSMPTYFMVPLLLWKLEIEKHQSPDYHEFKGLHHGSLASFMVSPGCVSL
jgi:hypothetical protein